MVDTDVWLSSGYNKSFLDTRARSLVSGRHVLSNTICPAPSAQRVMPSFAILLASASSCFAVSSIRSASAFDRSSEKIWTKGRGEWRVR